MAKSWLPKSDESDIQNGSFHAFRHGERGINGKDRDNSGTAKYHISFICHQFMHLMTCPKAYIGRQNFTF